LGVVKVAQIGLAKQEVLKKIYTKKTLDSTLTAPINTLQRQGEICQYCCFDAHSLVQPIRVLTLGS